MKNWIRIFLVCFILVGGTAFFAYQLLNQFNNAFDDISASSLAAASTPPILFSDKKNKEQPPTTIPETTQISTPEIISTSSISTGLEPPFIFPKENNEVYIGCRYELFSFQPSTAVRSLRAVLVDAGAIEIVEPIASGLVRENKIEPNSQSLDWKVGEVLPGEYYIKASSINGVDLENRSKVFRISRMPKDISADEREKICKDSGGSL